MKTFHSLHNGGVLTNGCIFIRSTPGEVFQGACYLQGALLITLKEAKNLPAADSNGLSDPYAKVKLGKDHRKSMIQYDTLNPVWSEKFDFVKVQISSHKCNPSAAVVKPQTINTVSSRLGEQRL